MMPTAATSLLIGGLLLATAGMTLGVPLSRIRTRSPAAPHHLVTAHLAAIIQGTLLIALTIAVDYSDLPSWLDTLAASGLVVGCVLFVSGATLNWRQQVGDHFAERSPGCYALAVSGPLNVVGITVLAVGALARAV